MLYFNTNVGATLNGKLQKERYTPLRSRGDVTIWLSEDAIAAWIPPKNGLRGGQRRYSNLAIRTALTLRVVFGLPLRQTEGFLDSLLSLMSRDLKAPDPITLSRRNQIVVVPPLTRAHDGPIDLIVDSTGLKILGRGEWNAHTLGELRRTARRHGRLAVQGLRPDVAVHEVRLGQARRQARRAH